MKLYNGITENSSFSRLTIRGNFDVIFIGYELLTVLIKNDN